MLTKKDFDRALDRAAEGSMEVENGIEAWAEKYGIDVIEVTRFCNELGKQLAEEAKLVIDGKGYRGLEVCLASAVMMGLVATAELLTEGENDG